MQPHPETRPAPARVIALRDAQPADVATLFAFECDPIYCQMAMIKPRSRAAFDAVWEKVFRDRAAAVGATDSGVLGPVQKIILIDGEVGGSIGCRLVDHGWAVGYGLGRAHWGRGGASRALQLLLGEVSRRPLHARVAATNIASIRVLTRNGFVITRTQPSPETERYLPCDEVHFLLA